MFGSRSDRDSVRDAIVGKESGSTARDAVRHATQDREGDDPDLKRNLQAAVQLQHQLDEQKETHRHREARYDKLIELAPVIIAAVVVVLGFGVFIGAMYAASRQQAQSEFWAKQGERGISTAVAALAYIFGKGTKPAS